MCNIKNNMVKLKKNSYKKNIKLILYIIALISPLMGALSIVVSKYVINNISPISLLFYRWLIAVLVMTPFMFKSFIKEREVILKNMLNINIVALSGVALFNLFLYYSLRYTSSANASIIINVFPVFVLLFERVINKNKLKIVQYFSIIVSLIGALVIVSHGEIQKAIENLFSNFGDFIVLASAITYAIYFFNVKSKSKDISFYTYVYTTFLLGTLYIFPLYLFDFLYLKNTFDPNSLNISIIFFLGIGVSIIGMVTLNYTILKFGATTASVLYYFNPLFTAIFAALILNEKLELYHLFGMLLIIIGVNLHAIYRIFNSRNILKNNFES